MNEKDSDNFSFLSPVSQGGVSALRGYTYQDAFIVSKIPDWLENRCFSMLMKEGIEDVDVKFEKDGRVKYYSYQVKNQIVGPSKLREVISKFLQKDKGIKRFILACRGFDEKCHSLRQALESYRNLREMHDESMLKGTKEDIVKRAEKIGLEPSVDFLIEKVVFDTELGDMHSHKRLCDQFVGGIQRISEFSDVQALNLNAAYRDLALLVYGSIRKRIKRDDILSLIRKSVKDSSVRFKTKGIRVRLYHWEDLSFDLSQPWDLLLDWSKHFDRETRKVPSTDVWSEKLIPELREAEKTVRSSTNSRRVIFYPSACLSAGVALGWAFNEVKGYSFDIHQGSDIWHSSTQPSKNRLMQEIVSMDETAKDLYVEFSVAANVGKKVDEFINETGKAFRARMSLEPDLGIGARIDGSIALAYSYDAKHRIRKKVDCYNCDSIHLFYAGPLGLAILFGRLLNAMHAEVQCYEEQQEGYTATCLLPAT